MFNQIFFLIINLISLVIGFGCKCKQLMIDGKMSIVEWKWNKFRSNYVMKTGSNK